MLSLLLAAGRSLLIQPSCPICRQPLPPETRSQTLCRPCRQRLRLCADGLSGSDPLPWHALALYDGPFRNLLLRLKQQPSKGNVNGLIRCLAMTLPQAAAAVLVPIPSWKRRHGNPLPALIAERLGGRRMDLLHRNRASVGQHHLKRKQRLTNLKGAFRVHSGVSPTDLFLVDDILTTGGTALAARDALVAAGHRVAGLICLGRTPARRPGR